MIIYIYIYKYYIGQSETKKRYRHASRQNMIINFLNLYDVMIFKSKTHLCFGLNMAAARAFQLYSFPFSKAP